MAVNVFISYSHKDELFKENFEEHLSSLKDQNIVNVWHDRKIIPGQEWMDEIDNNLKNSEIIIFLIMLIFIITFLTLFKIFYDNSIKQNPIYNSDIDIKYQVNNSNDSFYNSDISGQNEFISSIAKTIDLEINYKFQSDVDISYDYINKLKELGATMQVASKCGLGQSSPNSFISILENFKDEILNKIEA